MWIMFACIAAQGSTVCIPPQPMASEPVCKAIAREYRDTAALSNPSAKVTTRCVSVNQDGGTNEALDFRHPAP